FNVLGLDQASARDLPDIQDVNGDARRLDELASGEIYINASAADELEVKPGESILLITRGRQTTLRVKAIVKDRRLAGAGGVSIRREGGVLSLSAVQDLLGAPGKLTFIGV